MFLAYLKSDFLKTKRLSIRMAHLFIPIVAAILFVAYYSYAPWNELKKISIYYQVLGMGVPFLIGLFCVMLSEQEQTAGSFQTMLMAPKKLIPFLAKLLLLLIFGLAALVLASVIFGIAFLVVLGNDLVGIDFYLFASIIMLVSSIPLYILHLFLALEFNKGVSISLGIVESLVSALFLTGLGNSIWKYVPASWPARISTTFLSVYNGDTGASAELSGVFPICFVVTIGAMAFYVLWANHWQGAKNND